MFRGLAQRAEDRQDARRMQGTLAFVAKAMPPPARVLDLGARNQLSAQLETHGYQVRNTSVDLDADPEAVALDDVDAVTAFEILEHLVAPFNVLCAIRAPRLFATVPLRLWFAPAHFNADDPWDCHFHEFERWQFDRLLAQSGWRIVHRTQWVSPVLLPGIRPLLRLFTPRYYAVEASRK